MEHEAPLLVTIVLGLVLAFAFGFMANQLRLPPLVGYLVAGIAMAHRDDDKRLERASAVFEDLYEYFRRKGHVKGPPSEALGAGRKGEHVT